MVEDKVREDSCDACRVLSLPCLGDKGKICRYCEMTHRTCVVDGTVQTASVTSRSSKKTASSTPVKVNHKTTFINLTSPKQKSFQPSIDISESPRGGNTRSYADLYGETTLVGSPRDDWTRRAVPAMTEPQPRYVTAQSTVYDAYAGYSGYSEPLTPRTQPMRAEKMQRREKITAGLDRLVQDALSRKDYSTVATLAETIQFISDNT